MAKRKHKPGLDPELFDYTPFVEKPPVGPEVREKLSSLVRQAHELERLLAKQEAAAKETREKLQGFVEFDIPAVLEDMDLGKVEIDGLVVSVEPKIHANISAKRCEDAHKWLRERGYGDMIKNEITVNFPRGEESQADEFYQKIVDEERDAKRKESVHNSTLKSLVKKRLEDGKEIDFDLLGVYRRTEAVIKPKK